VAYFNLSLELLLQVKDKETKLQGASEFAAKLIDLQAGTLLETILNHDDFRIFFHDASMLIEGIGLFSAAIVETVARLHARLGNLQSGRAFLESISSLRYSGNLAPLASAVAVGFVVLGDVDRAIRIAGTQKTEVRDSMLLAIFRALLELNLPQRGCQVVGLIEDAGVKSDSLVELVSWHMTCGGEDEALAIINAIPARDSKSIALCLVAQFFIRAGSIEIGLSYLSEAREGLPGAAEHRLARLVQCLAESLASVGRMLDAKDLIDTLEDSVERENVAHGVLASLVVQGQTNRVMDWATIVGNASVLESAYDSIVRKYIRERKYAHAVHTLIEIHNSYVRAWRCIDIADSLEEHENLEITPQELL
jgi:hypothetical protein